ncbi:MAG: hypothetical protein JXB38_18785 [Anaerolineales bacterium]|nr:hypothetical protein [Anaerolineales bacterium]
MKKRKKTLEIVSPVPRYASIHRTWATYYLLTFLFISFVMLVGSIYLHELGSPNLAISAMPYSIHEDTYAVSRYEIPSAKLYAVRVWAQNLGMGLQVAYIPEFYYCSPDRPGQGWSVQSFYDMQEGKGYQAFFNGPADCELDVLAGRPIDTNDALSRLQALRKQELGIAYERWPQVIVLEYDENNQLIWKAKYRQIFNPQEYEYIVIDAASGDEIGRDLK